MRRDHVWEDDVIADQTSRTENGSTSPLETAFLAQVYFERVL